MVAVTITEWWAVPTEWWAVPIEWWAVPTEWVGRTYRVVGRTYRNANQAITLAWHPDQPPLIPTSSDPLPVDLYVRQLCLQSGR